MTAMINLILHACDELNFDEQMTLAEKIRRRALKKRRVQLNIECDEARADVKAGNSIKGVDGHFAVIDKGMTNAKNKKR